MKLYTIGFTRKSANKFFGLLRESGADRLVDVRLHNVSQLAGFAKRDDLVYFLEELCGMSYAHRVDLAPTHGMLDRYKKGGMSWAEYEESFRELMASRQIELTVPPELLDNAVLLCSEDKPHECHRRLVAEHMTRHWADVTTEHLV